MSQQGGLNTDKLSAVHTESSLLSFIILIKIPCIDKTKYMHLHELLYFFNFHLNLSNKTLRRYQRTKQTCVNLHSCFFFFTLQVTVKDSNNRLGHPKKRLIIYRVSKGMCRRQLRDLECLAQASGNVWRLRRAAGESGGYCQVPASHHPMPPDAPWMEGTHLEIPPSHLENTCQKFPWHLSSDPLFLNFSMESIS